MKTKIGNDSGLIANGIRRSGGIHIFDDNQAKYIDPNVEITASTYDTIDTIVYDNTNIATEFTILNDAKSSTGNLVATGIDGYGIADIGTTDTVTLINNIESDFVLQNISASSTVDTLNTTVPIQDGDNLVLVKDDDSIHGMVASGVTPIQMSETWIAPISDNEDITKIFNGSNPMTLRVYGSTENDKDFMYVYDEAGTQIAKLSGTFDNDYTINGSTCSVRYTSDYSDNYGPAQATASWNGIAMDTSAITQGEVPSKVYAQPKVEFDTGSGFVESVLDSSTPVLDYGSSNIKANPTMTSNTAPSGVCSASSIYATTWEAWKAFDGSNAAEENSWESEEDSPTGWVQYEFPSRITISKYAVTTFNHANKPEACPKTWIFEGSNTGTEGDWILLDTQTNRPETINFREEFSINNITEFKYYRLNNTENHGASYVAIGELELYEMVSILDSHNYYASTDTSTTVISSKVILRQIEDRMTDMTLTLRKDKI